MQAVRNAIEAAHGGPGVWDGVCLVVGMPATGSARRDATTEKGVADVDAHEEWEDACWDLAFEYVDGRIAGDAPGERNPAGERMGIARAREALEACEWDAVADDDDVDGEEDAFGLLGDSGEETAGFGLERAQMEREFAGLKMAMMGDGLEDENEGEEGVEELERMMGRLQAVKGEFLRREGT